MHRPWLLDIGFKTNLTSLIHLAMRIAGIKNWIREHQMLLMMGATLIASQVILNVATGPRSANIVDQYFAQSLAGRVDTILYRTRGFPTVRLSTGEVFLLILPYGGQRYLQVGDSIVKKGGTKAVTTYRKFPSYTEVSIFTSGNDSSDAEGLLKRYRIPQ
jgi:hypothetical protein